jgi:hypothetical protein
MWQDGKGRFHFEGIAYHVIGDMWMGFHEFAISSLYSLMPSRPGRILGINGCVFNDYGLMVKGIVVDV